MRTGDTGVWVSALFLVRTAHPTDPSPELVITDYNHDQIRSAQ